MAGEQESSWLEITQVPFVEHEGHRPQADPFDLWAAVFASQI